MGGGPDRAEREAAAAAERRAQEQAQIQRQLITIAQAEDPLETRLRERDMSWLDWSEGKTGPLDVSKAPGLGPSLGLYESAARGQQGERMGIGALRMGLDASNPNLSALLNEQAKARREQEAAGGLERAVAMKDAEVNRSALPLAAFAQDRRMGLASLASGNANTSQGQYLGFLANRPQRPSFWRTLSQSFGGSLGSSAGQFVGSGAGFFGAGGGAGG